ncbi:hypothetical protein CSL66_002370 [Salmonella enterica subsp. houtenae]|nr:hypothetical protein [Salmonella enterica subsp. houtenae]
MFFPPFRIGLVSGEDPKPSSLNDFPFLTKKRKRKLTAVCSHQTRIGNLDAHLI